MPRPRLKVCCIASPAEAALAIRAGADALGLVGKMPSGPGPIDDALIADIAKTVPPPIATFLLTSETTEDAVVAHIQRCGANTVQLVDRVSPSVHRAIRRDLPAIRIVQVVHVEGPDSVAEAVEAANTADAILLDSGNTRAQIRELGGTGRTHDWSLSRRIVESCAKPVFLAGGLNAGNVAAAIAAVRPFGIDVCSGVRTKGALDEAKLAAFAAVAVQPTT
jgi:phosphoribosylanthranilate isomerase